MRLVSFEKRRCLLPLSAWAEAEGAKGGTTRTWLTVPDVDLFAIAAIWRDSDEGGPAYSMVMTDAVGDAAQVPTLMPVILKPADYDTWQNDRSDTAKALCTAWAGDLAIDRTGEPWFRKSAK